MSKMIWRWPIAVQAFAHDADAVLVQQTARRLAVAQGDLDRTSPRLSGEQVATTEDLGHAGARTHTGGGELGQHAGQRLVATTTVQFTRDATGDTPRWQVGQDRQDGQGDLR
jgi:hypothetical protein